MQTFNVEACSDDCVLRDGAEPLKMTREHMRRGDASTQGCMCVSSRQPGERVNYRRAGFFSSRGLPREFPPRDWRGILRLVKGEILPTTRRGKKYGSIHRQAPFFAAWRLREKR